jgi:hypothetical protein
MDNIAKEQEVLLQITKIIETEHVHDANRLLDDGFILLSVNKIDFEDDDNKFIYSLGFAKPLSELPEWAKKF